MAYPQSNEVFDAGKQKIAAVYAKALLGAHDASQSEALIDELDALVVEVLDKHPAFEQILNSQLVPLEEKAEILQRTLGKHASPDLLVFLQVLAAHGRLDCLRTIRREAREQLDQLQGRVNVGVRLAAPTDEALLQDIRNRLQAKLQAEPVLHVVQEPELIGGFVVRVGDTVFDSSVRTHLEQMRGEMVERSVELIQTKRQQLVG